MDQNNNKFVRKIGRRKTAVAQVQLVENGEGNIVINGRDYKVYFTTLNLQERVTSPLKAVGVEKRFNVSIKVSGGGISGQADAVKLGISRTLVEHNNEWRTVLKKLECLRMDARKKERKKYGLKGARRAPQWSKR